MQREGRNPRKRQLWLNFEPFNDLGIKKGIMKKVWKQGLIIKDGYNRATTA